MPHAQTMKSPFFQSLHNASTDAERRAMRILRDTVHLNYRCPELHQSLKEYKDSVDTIRLFASRTSRMELPEIKLRRNIKKVPSVVIELDKEEDDNEAAPVAVKLEKQEDNTPTVIVIED